MGWNKYRGIRGTVLYKNEKITFYDSIASLLNTEFSVICALSREFKYIRENMIFFENNYLNPSNGASKHWILMRCKFNGRSHDEFALLISFKFTIFLRN